MIKERVLREHLRYLLDGNGAHVSFDQAVADLPQKLQGKRAPGVPHTLWQLVEHLRIAQWDILEFSRNPRHVSPEFPKGYWPTSDSPASVTAWKRSVAGFHSGLAGLRKLVNDPALDLFAPLPHGDGQTLLREVLLAADHNAYHIGEIVILRRSLGAWKGAR